MAMTYSVLGVNDFIPAHEAFPKARAAADHALAIDDELSEAHAALFRVHVFYDWDWAAGERDVRRALQLNPDNAWAHLAMGTLHIVLGQFSEAIEEGRRAIELDPLSPAPNLASGTAFVLARRYDDAIEQLRKTIELDPGIGRPHELLATAYAQAGMYDPAIAECQVANSLPGSEAAGLALLGYVYALRGKTAKARGILEELRPALGKDLRVSLWATYVCAALKEFDLAFELLDILYAQRFGLLIIYLRHDPAIDSLRSEPRFEELLRRIGLPQ